jgi:hypothetical protein
MALCNATLSSLSASKRNKALSEYGRRATALVTRDWLLTHIANMPNDEDTGVAQAKLASVQACICVTTLNLRSLGVES